MSLYIPTSVVALQIMQLRHSWAISCHAGAPQPSCCERYPVTLPSVPAHHVPAVSTPRPLEELHRTVFSAQDTKQPAPSLFPPSQTGAATTRTRGPGQGVAHTDT